MTQLDRIEQMLIQLLAQKTEPPAMPTAMPGSFMFNRQKAIEELGKKRAKRRNQ